MLRLPILNRLDCFIPIYPLYTSGSSCSSSNYLMIFGTIAVACLLKKLVIIKYYKFTILIELRIMRKYTRLRIHIAPLGFETDRIVLPAIEMKADKIWILIHNDPKQTEARPYLQEIKSRLKQHRIDYEMMELNRLNLFSTIKGIREIIESEKENSYYVNVSSGSKIQAVACTMATMMFHENNNLTPYYVEPEQYFPFRGKPQSSGMKNIRALPQYEIQIPEKRLVKALEIIENNNGKISKKDLADKAEEMKLFEVGGKEENYDQARFGTLNKNFVQPLKEKWGFIREQKIGRSIWLEITEEGRNVKEILS